MIPTNLADVLFQALAGLAFGLCAGSLIANFAHRWPDRLAGFVGGRSRCEACGTVLGVADLVPVASWILSRGRCRHCDAAVPSRYTFVELACGLTGLFSLALLPPVPGVAVALAGWILLAMSLVDLDHMILPDMLTLPLLGGGLLLAWAMPSVIPDWPGPDVAMALLGAAIGSGGLFAVREAYRRLRGREGLGLGDVKLMGAAGAWLGPEPLVHVLLIGALAGLATAFRHGLSLTSTTPIPFGPALAFAFWIVLLMSWQ
ncbi:MAG: A24 family peptidase [Geminicoccaceae bacterium]